MFCTQFGQKITFYPQQFTGVFRSSQTCEGLLGNANDADEDLLRSMGLQRIMPGDQQATKLFVLDLRTHVAAMGNKAGGGGYHLIFMLFLFMV